MTKFKTFFLFYLENITKRCYEKYEYLVDKIAIKKDKKNAGI